MNGVWCGLMVYLEIITAEDKTTVSMTTVGKIF